MTQSNAVANCIHREEVHHNNKTLFANVIEILITQKSRVGTKKFIVCKNRLATDLQAVAAVYIAGASSCSELLENDCSYYERNMS